MISVMLCVSHQIGERKMIKFDDGLSLCARVTCGYQAGYIIEIGAKTYRVRWLDGEISTQLRPDLDCEDETLLQAAE